MTLGGINYNIADIDGSKYYEVFGVNLHADIKVDLENKTGYHIGAGLNFPLTDNLNLFTEYRYTFLKFNKGDRTIYVGENSVTESVEIPDVNYDFGLLKIGINHLY